MKHVIPLWEYWGDMSPSPPCNRPPWYILRSYASGTESIAFWIIHISLNCYPECNAKVNRMLFATQTRPTPEGLSNLCRDGRQNCECHKTDAMILVLGLINAGTCTGASSAQAMRDWIRTCAFTVLKDVLLIYTAPDFICNCKESITIAFISLSNAVFFADSEQASWQCHVGQFVVGFSQELKHRSSSHSPTLSCDIS